MRIDWRRLIPGFWVQTCPTSLEWDAMLNDLMDRHDPTEREKYTIKFGSINIWIENWPYAYGRPYNGFRQGGNPTVDVVPTVKTRLRLRAFVDGIPIKGHPSDREKLAIIAGMMK